MATPPNLTTRRGAATTETAVVLVVVLLLTVGVFDLGMGIFRNNLLSQGARQGARLAVVHGKLATQLGAWGPDTYRWTGDSSDPIANEMRPYLAGLDPSLVDITVEWLDGSNEIGRRVRVTMSTRYQPFLTIVFGNTTYTLIASSTLRITH